jgi:peptidoglycan/LPS O-acetylase OafA/YrhL
MRRSVPARGQGRSRVVPCLRLMVSLYPANAEAYRFSLMRWRRRRNGSWSSDHTRGRNRNIVLDRQTGTICIVMSVALFSIHYTTPQFRSAQWGIPAVLLVFGMLSYDTSRVLHHPLLVLGGSASYAIYLSPITVDTLAYKLEGTYGAGGLGYKIAVFVVELSPALTVGAVFHFVIERPLIASLRAARDKVIHARGLAHG